MPSLKETNLRTLVFSARRRLKKLTIPPEIWAHILSFLADSALVPLYRVNRLFYNVAMDSLYRDLSFCDGKGFVLGNKCLRDAQLKKRIKSVHITNSALWVDEELGILPEPKQVPRYSRCGITSIFYRRKKRCEFIEQGPLHRTPHEMIAEHILNVLDGADNLEELRFTHDYPYGDHSLSILLSLSAAFSNRGSPLKLYVEGDRLDMVLPSVQFHGLKEVNVALSLSYDLWHLKEAVSTFVKHVSPSVEILRFSVPDRDHPGSISLHMTEILRNDALTMPSLRELTTPLMVSPDPMSIFHMMNTKYGSLTKLDLHMNVENLCLDVPLHCLALPHLRILCLKFAPDARIFGLWDGECGLTQLEEFRIKGRYLRLAEVDSMCRFFAPTQLISLSAKVSTLDGSLLRVLANNLPLLRDLDLFALRLVWERCVQTTQTMAHTIAHFEADVKARGLQGWGLKRFSVSLNINGIVWSRDPKLSPPHQVASILARCIPSIRTTASDYHPPDYM